MNKTIIALIFAIGIIFLITRVFNVNPLSLVKDTPSPTPTVDNWLPSDWHQIDSDSNQLKLERTVESGLKPEIILIKSERPDSSDPKTYSDRIIAGAKSSLPSLRYTSDNTLNENNMYLRTLSGYYYNQKLKVLVSQRLYLQDNQVYTLTASYADPAMETEINSIFDSIVSRRLPS